MAGINFTDEREYLPKLKLNKIMKKETVVISAFPGVGKSFLFKKLIKKGVKVLDSDSSKFSWESEGVRNKNFPNNYIEHIQENIGEVDFIFASSHKEVRLGLELAKIEYNLVYPHESLIKEYVSRFEKRKNDEKFISFIKANWFDFINELKNDKTNRKIELLSGMYLSDVIFY